MLETYRDGVGIDRCVACHHPIRSAADRMPITAMRSDDLEGIVKALVEIATLLEAVTHLLERAVGRSSEQLRRVAAAEAEAIPGDRKTDRAGLLDDEGED
jgi:hypothetical protein